MLRARTINILLHTISAGLPLFLQDIDSINFFLTLLISFLISNLFLSSKDKYLSFEKIFLIGAYYYLVIFPLSYSFNLFKVDTFNPWDLSMAILICILGLIGYLVGDFTYRQFENNSSSHLKSRLDYTHGLGSKRIDGALICLFLATNIILMISFNEIRTFFIISTVVTLLVYIKFTNLAYSIKAPVIFITICASIIAIIGFTSSRSDLIKLVIVMGFLYSFLNQKKVNLVKLASVGFLLFMGGILISINRTYTGMTFADGFDRIYGTYQGVVGILTRLGDIGVAYDNLIYLIKNISFDELLLGSSLIRPLFFLIPRSIWPGKPLDTQLLIVDERYGAISEFGGGTSQSITLVGELFWNFSFFGVFFGFFFLSLIIKSLDSILYKTKSLSTIYLLSVLSPFFFIIWRGAYSSELVYTLISIIPILLLILLHKFFKELPIRRLER
jgi:hypothetical protein